MVVLHKGNSNPNPLLPFIILIMRHWNGQAAAIYFVFVFKSGYVSSQLVPTHDSKSCCGDHCRHQIPISISNIIIYYFKHSSFMQPFMPQSINWITLHLGVLVLKNKCAVGTAFKSFRARQTNRTCIAMVLNSNADVFDFPLSTNLLQNLSVRLCLVFPEWKDGSLDSRFRKKRK